jgi:uncharacterized protein HemX
MIHQTSFASAADDVASSLASYGLAGAILAALVAPVLYVLVKAQQKREDAQVAADTKEAERRALREEKLLDALVTSVKNQREAIDEWKHYTKGEEQTHASILAALNVIASHVVARGQ